MELTKVDLKQNLKHLYNPSAKEYTVIDVPAMNFLMIHGIGDPNTSEDYKHAIETLYAVSYAIKFAVRKQQGLDYPIMALEGLWWTDDGALDFTADDRNHWNWTMMMMQPEFVTAELVHIMIAEVAQKKNPPALSRLWFEEYDEGRSVQIMHIGPYSAEHPTIVGMHHFIDDIGHESNGKHHEVYLSDPTRTAPERLKTVLRQPIRPK
ncbi:MAG: GyrI-like domain-containing protein [Anaerolineae bacterium]